MPETLTERPAALPRLHSKTTHTSRKEAPWHVLAYLAADNDLEGELLADLAEMERVGSTPGVVDTHVLASSRLNWRDGASGSKATYRPSRYAAYKHRIGELSSDHRTSGNN